MKSMETASPGIPAPRSSKAGSAVTNMTEEPHINKLPSLEELTYSL
jgi:hypothetical protein